MDLGDPLATSDAFQITTLTPLPNVWVIANFKETQLTHIAVGQA
jgi:multidrug resistance efflux pump